VEIAPGVHRIKCLFEPNRVSYIHLFIGSRHALLFDTCCAHNPEQEILPYMRSIGFDPARLTYIVISHSDMDHQGGNAPMKAAAPQAVLMCHTMDKPWIESTDALINGRYDQFSAGYGIAPMTEADKAGIRKQTLSAPIEMTLEGGERFYLSSEWAVEVIHTPGHSWGHLSIYDPRSRTLAANEAALWTSILDVNWQPALPPTYGYAETYLATIERLLGMDIAQYSPSHWALQTGPDVREFLYESRSYFYFVEKTLLNYAKHGAFTLPQAIQDLARQLGNWDPINDGALANPLMANLRLLTARGLLTQGVNAEGVAQWDLPD